MYAVTIIKLDYDTYQLLDTELNGIISLAELEKKLIRIKAPFELFDTIVELKKGDSITSRVTEYETLIRLIYIHKID